jgi:hypothetical protein
MRFGIALLVIGLDYEIAADIATATFYQGFIG